MRPATPADRLPGPEAESLRDGGGDRPRARTRRGRFRLADRRVTTRLIALIVIPAAVAGILAGLRVRDAMNDAAVYTRVEHLATLGDRLAGLVHELEEERDLTVQFLSLPTSARTGRAQDVRNQHDATDRAARLVRGATDGVDGDYSPQAIAKVRDIRYRLDNLATVRRTASGENASAFATLDIYSQVIASLLEFDDLIAQGSPNAALSESTRAFASLARAKDFASQERVRVTMTLLKGRFANPADREHLEAMRSQQDTQIALFRSAATVEQRQHFEDVVTGPEIGRLELLYQQVLVRSDASRTLSVRPLRARDAAGWDQAASSRIQQMRTVERRMSSSLVNTSRSLQDDAWRAAFTDAAVLLIGLLLAGLATIIVARSLVRPLRRLQTGALEVAGTRLPSLVDRLRDPEAAAGGIEVEPIDVDSADEIGQVARAFDEVHREAVRLAADEAVLRGNINAMFVNLSRRSQTLIEGQLQLIEKLEQSERDEEQLANLFQLDHLATRMRRNCENLLVLGGQEQVRRRNQPVPLIDVVRASLSEVEQYERVSLRVHGDMTVAGPVVNDLVHLLAELIENATVFSSEQTKVTVSGQLLSGGGAMLQINDNGVGMAPDVLEQANWRLANPPVIDFAAARRMGLFVVGRLAVRHGIRVELRAAQGGGLTAFVMLPEGLIIPSEAGVGGGRFGGRAPEPRTAGGVALAEQPPMVAEEPLPGARPHRGGTGPLPRVDAGGPVMRTTAPQPVVRDSGAHPMFGPRDGSAGAAANGAAESWDEAPEIRPAYGGGRPDVPGPQPVFGGESRDRDTGAHPMFGPRDGSLNGAGAGGAAGWNDAPEARPAYGGPRRDTGAQPVVGDARPPGRDTGVQPVVHDAFGQSFGHEQTEERPPAGGHGEGGDRFATGAQPMINDTGAQPVVPPARPEAGLPVRRPGAQLPGRPGAAAVPEAQPVMPERTAPPRRVSWDTGPLPETPADQRAQDGAPAGPSAPFTLEEPIPEPPAPEPPVAVRPPARPPARSPIFDAMQSEWFQRRDGGPGGNQDPARGWASPADAGFEAAAAAAKPAADRRTSAGLPKRVPGKNRVPGAVAAQPAPPVVPQAEQQPAAPAPSAEQVRNRFSSLQRGVHKGRSETRGEPGSERPSWNDGETGGTR
ncbi:sensor histidine kinase [Actinomadura macrotermitis]|uniref:histidine kinase n=1 Tax=Actinomadura macrotermitis TaxID=2585200 RepID=A0A7K0C2Z8_9ACTN|nr:hypothetical protein [Actinomadura macrotermitis]